MNSFVFVDKKAKENRNENEIYISTSSESATFI